jgi:hypothetical protein
MNFSGGGMPKLTRNGKARDVQPEHVAVAGIWSWLRQPSNQKTLSFIGAGVAAVLALLMKLGVFEKPQLPNSPAIATEAASLPSVASAPSAAIANSGGVAVNVPGASNVVTINR